LIRRGAALLAGLVAAAALPACYTGAARDASQRQIASDPSWQLVRDVPFVAQQSDRDCGAAAIAMVLAYWRVPTPIQEVTGAAPPTEGGISAGALRDVARRKGLNAFIVSGTLGDLVDQIGRGRPVLVGLAKPMTGGRAAAHYEVVVGINRTKRLILSLDPARGLRENSLEGFAREWVPTHQVTLVVFPSTPPPPHPPSAMPIAAPLTSR
jgi:ABC-type bacteriocin/lantibiotic exporter with double-glycine peptidase domain